MGQTACKPGSVIRLATRDGHSSGPPLAGRFSRPTRTARTGDGPTGANSGAPPLFGLAPGGACHAVPIAGSAVGSYPTLSPLPTAEAEGGLLSVALSLRSPSAGVARRHITVEPGLSSTLRKAPRPPGRLARVPTAPNPSQGQGWGAAGRASKAPWGAVSAPPWPARGHTPPPRAARPSAGRGSRRRRRRRGGAEPSGAGRR